MVTNAQGQTQSIDWTDDHQPFVHSDVSGVLTTYGYDADGERVSLRRGTDYFRYFSSIVEHSNTGLTKSYYAGSLLVARKIGTTTRWFHGDQIGSVRTVTDPNGVAFQRHDYEPFGQQTGAAAAPFGSSVAFAGKQNDQNGLVYMGARYYDPALARFISPDTIVPDAGNPQATNPYSYAFNSPLSFVDPTGHRPQGISQQMKSESGAFSITLTLGQMPPPATVSVPARPQGQICSGCHGDASIYSGTPRVTPYTPPANLDPRTHDEKVVDLIGQYRAASRSEYEAWDRAREDYRLINLKGGDVVLRDAEHFLFRYWLASRPTFGEVVWIPRPNPGGKGVGETTEDPWYKAPMNAWFMHDVHDPIYNPLRENVLEHIQDIAPTTPSMYEWERRGYGYGFCAAGDCNRLLELESTLQRRREIYQYVPPWRW
jgi:RHS repeat-associated protein